ncbi:hypothetical protein [Methyloversatilis sp. XJ19-49]|uniref:hypothetical protein n=1 Tax=Methyloversatilis sp. XJ19-49 TaxID=2963429 RepID=UPI00211CDFAD|nr:hypothetical protein [Methyloversatilis sp. XJ19-49]MCQ9377576.1 hypothetical protein [Methyloversatilis sp. XJ19-49]
MVIFSFEVVCPAQPVRTIAATTAAVAWARRGLFIGVDAGLSSNTQSVRMRAKRRGCDPASYGQNRVSEKFWVHA